MFLAFVLTNWLAWGAVHPPTERPPEGWCAPDRFEPNDERRRSRALDEPADAHLCVGDDDWFRLRLTAGEAVTLVADGLTGTRSELAAFAPRRRKPSARARGQGPVRVTWTARRTGTYRVRVRHRGGPASSYRLEAVRPAPGPRRRGGG